jgi:hypothetical protein
MHKKNWNPLKLLWFSMVCSKGTKWERYRGNHHE